MFFYRERQIVLSIVFTKFGKNIPECAREYEPVQESPGFKERAKENITINILRGLKVTKV